MSRRETSSEIDDAAAAWAARVDRSRLSPADQAELEAWLAADPRRLGAYGKARAVLLHTLRARALGPNYDPTDFLPARTTISRRAVLLAGGGAAAAAAIGGTVILSPDHYSTRLGEVRLVPLADGSTITLNTGSTVSVRFAPNIRHIRLLGGEALFDVAKDPKRPFIVDAGEAQVRAVGTSFTVRRFDDQALEVLVREGVVEMRHTAPATLEQPAPIRISANMRAITRSAEAPIETAAISADALRRQMAWREGMIAFDGITLAEAAQAFGRYSEMKIIIADPQVGARLVTGLFSASNPIGFARAVAASFDLHAEVGTDQVLIRK